VRHLVCISDDVTYDVIVYVKTLNNRCWRSAGTTGSNKFSSCRRHFRSKIYLQCLRVICYHSIGQRW